MIAFEDGLTGLLTETLIDHVDMVVLLRQETGGPGTKRDGAELNVVKPGAFPRVTIAAWNDLVGNVVNRGAMAGDPAVPVRHQR